jgi:hypothetical protein
MPWNARKLQATKRTIANIKLFRSDFALRVKALESLLVEKGLVDARRSIR